MVAMGFYILYIYIFFFFFSLLVEMTATTATKPFTSGFAVATRQLHGNFTATS